MTTEKKVKIRSSDEEIFEIDKSMACEFQTLKYIIQDIGTEEVIPLPNIRSKTLAQIIEYCKYHMEAKEKMGDKPISSNDDISQSWDVEFFKMDNDALFQLINASDYLHIPSLLDLACQRAADNLKNKTVEEVRETFKIPNDFTLEEEEEEEEIPVDMDGSPL